MADTSSGTHAFQCFMTVLGNVGEDIQQFGLAEHRGQCDGPLEHKSPFLWVRQAHGSGTEVQQRYIPDARTSPG